jgi:hypothetical protein
MQIHCLLDPTAAKAACGPISSFFGDVKPELQIAFAQMHGITEAQLVTAAKTLPRIRASLIRLQRERSTRLGAAFPNSFA